MSDTAIKLGMIVRHPNKPEWGPGKVVKLAAGKAWVVWRDLPDREAKVLVLTHAPLVPADDQHDPVLDNLPPLTEEGGKLVLPRLRVPFDDAVAQFLNRFPLGFKDPGYIGDRVTGERMYKWVAHEAFVRRLGDGRLRQLLASEPDAAVAEIVRCVREVNLVSPFEKAAFSDGMADAQAARRLAGALADLIEAEQPDEATFGSYAQALVSIPAERGRVATWPVATLIPYLLQPDRHMFLKPEVTQNAAEALGFHLNYRATPNWTTYSRLLAMTRLYREKLKPLAPQDNIDVQSFYWVACGGYEPTGGAGAVVTNCEKAATE